MTVEIWLDRTSLPKIYKNVLNAYEKGSFYCIYLDTKKVVKYPIDHLFRVIEDYPDEFGASK